MFRFLCAVIVVIFAILFFLSTPSTQKTVKDAGKSMASDVATMAVDAVVEYAEASARKLVAKTDEARAAGGKTLSEAGKVVSK